MYTLHTTGSGCGWGPVCVVCVCVLCRAGHVLERVHECVCNVVCLLLYESGVVTGVCECCSVLQRVVRVVCGVL